MSKLEVDAIEPQSGTTLTIGASGDSVNIASGATITDFTSTGIDDNATSTAITIDSSERVGIGESSPDVPLHVTSAENSLAYFESTDANANIRFADGNSTGFPVGIGATGTSGNEMTLIAGGNDVVRIDSSGRLFVNATSSILDGSEKFGVNGGHSSFQFSNTPVLVNKTGTDGEIISFRKDGTVVGRIGTLSDDLFICSSTSGHAGLSFANINRVLPADNSGTVTDNQTDLGAADARFDDLYATNGTIQTSDQNEKQSIQSLTTAEMNVAKRLSPLIKTFKFNSAVEEKGDSARTHTGIIAQDVQQAFTDEGLDAGNYALFISSTWWEKEIFVDAVQAQEAVYETQTDEEGNEIQVLVKEATKEQEAYTYMDTKEEATDGYTERTRLGVRYPELLSFIQAYNEQRFTELEARITALENA